MKNSGGFSDKIAKDPLGAATLASFFGNSGQQFQMKEGAKYESKIVEDDGNDSKDEKEENKQEVNDNNNRRCH
jgi:hypothetical protein